MFMYPIKNLEDLYDKKDIVMINSYKNEKEMILLVCYVVFEIN